ncbi:hypothetical protein EB093_08810 [bacterium]|nr:hypothetical protein [bacterium]
MSGLEKYDEYIKTLTKEMEGTPFVIFTLNEKRYFELQETLFSQNEVKNFVTFAALLYEQILEMDWTDNVTDNFLYKCYVGTLHVTVAIIQQSIADINRNGDDELKTTAVRALWMLHKMRVKLGEYLLERVDDPAFTDRISACMNGSATTEEKRTVVEMHRCRLHIQSREFSSSQYMFDTFTYGHLRKDFDRLYAAVTGAEEDKFLKNIENCMRSPLIEYVK